MNVLIVSGGSFQGLTILRNLQRISPARLVLADWCEENIGREFAHRFYCVPPIASGAEFVGALLEICRSESIRLVIPSTQFELQILAANRARFEETGSFVAVSQPNLLKILADKLLTSEYAREHGFPALPTLTWEMLPAHLPVVAKPRSGWGGRGLMIVDEPAQLSQVADPASMLFQPCLRNFDEYSCDFALGPERRISTLHIRRRIRTVGGFAVLSEFVEEDRLRSVAERFARQLAADGGLGLFNVQFLVTGQDCFLSDVNPRVGTSAVGFPDGSNPVVALCGWFHAAPEAITGTEAFTGPAEITGASSVTSPADVATPRQRSAADPAQGASGNGGPDRIGKRVIRYLDEIVLPVRRMDGVNGVVLDLDDTLFDQKRWIRGKLEGLHQAFHPMLPAQTEFVLAGVMLVDEGHRADLIDRLIQRFAIPASRKQQLIDAYRCHVPIGDFVYNDVYPVLDELRRRGLRIGIITDNPVESQKQKLITTALTAAVDEIVFSRECGSEKPSRKAFDAIADRLGIRPQELVMAGDNLHRDALGAIQADYHTAFVVQRRGSLLNCDPASLAGLVERADRILPIDGLFPLLRYVAQRDGRAPVKTGDALPGRAP